MIGGKPREGLKWSIEKTKKTAKEVCYWFLGQESGLCAPKSLKYNK